MTAVTTIGLQLKPEPKAAAVLNVSVSWDGSGSLQHSDFLWYVLLPDSKQLAVTDQWLSLHVPLSFPHWLLYCLQKKKEGTVDVFTAIGCFKIAN